MHKGQLFSYQESRKIIMKGSVYYIIRVRNVDSKTLILESVVVVKELPLVFPNDLPDAPSERYIDFGIDVFPHTQPISIPPYGMDQEELKELKDQLKELLEKGFI